MSLRFIYGRAGSGKSHFCFQDMKSKLEKGENDLILLVPEDFSFQAEKDLLNFIGEKGLLHARVLSFKRMAYMAFSMIGGLNRSHIDNAGKAMLIYRIMDECKEGFKVFKRSVKMQGFVNTISDIITELKTYDVDPGMLENVANKIDDDILKDKLHDIEVIYSDFEDTLHKKYIDQDDDLTLLSQKLDKSSLFDGCEIWVDGFSVFTPQQYDILGKLLKKAKRVNITLCMDCSGDVTPAGTDVFLPIENIEKKMLEIARENNVPYDNPVKLNDKESFKFKNHPELCHLERNIFSYPYSRYLNKTSHISIFKAASRYSEVENTARDIISLVRDEKFRFCDIAVVTNDVEGYEKLIGAIFKEYSIPYFLDKKRDIDIHPLIVLILSVLEILSKKWTYEPVFRYLKTGLLDIDREDVDILENYVLSSGIRGKKWTDDKDWSFWPDYGYEGRELPDAKERLKRINDIRWKIVQPIERLENDISKDKRVRNMCSSLFDFLCSIDIPEKIEGIIDKFKKSGELDLADEYSKVWNIVVETLEQSVEVLGDEDIQIEQFSKVLSAGFGEYKIGLIPPSIDQVMFGNVKNIKSHNVKALYIIGVNDGIFPSPKVSKGVLDDGDREELKSFGIELAPGSRDKAFDEQYLIYTAFTRTDKYLKISYPIADHEGRSMRPSIIISRLKKIFKNITECSDVIPDYSDDCSLRMVQSPDPTFNELVHRIRKSADMGTNINGIWSDVYNWYMNNKEWRNKTVRVLSGLSYKNQVDNIKAEKVKNLYGKNLHLSISRLEKFAECPFAYFMQYGLKAKERKIYEFKAPDLGSFIHEVLDLFSKYLDDNKINWRDIEKDGCASIISRIVDDTVEKRAGSILSSSARYNYIKEKLKRIIIRAVMLISLQIKKGGFNVVAHEVSFENGGKYPPISIDLPSGEKVSLIGRIDRVDRFEDDEGIYIRVVDYKSGNKKFDLCDIYNGLELQLLIYIDAILEYASKRSKKPVFPGGILYFKIDDPIISTDSDMPQDQVEKEIIKRLRMMGLVLSDVKVVREMDRDIKGWSIIIPASINSKGGLDLRSSAATFEQFEALRDHVKKEIVKICEEMLKGNISIAPYKKGKDIPCSFCSFKAICRFDRNTYNTYRIIDKIKKDEIWDLVMKEGGKIEMDTGAAKSH